MSNIAYIDNQNLYMATTVNDENPWVLDMKKFREYLRLKYKCEDAYLFMGAHKQEQEERYILFQKYGYILVFREHIDGLKGKKKGNVDTDIVFKVMSDLIEEEGSDYKVVLVSGDGDYKRMVDYLIKKERFEKILFPSKDRASSLYKKISNKYYAPLDTEDMRAKLKIEEK